MAAASLKQYSNLIVYRGSYTHTRGAASETVAISAGYPILVLISHNSATEKHDLTPTAFSHAVSGKVRTVTIHDQSAVAAGEIIIICIPG